MKIIQTSNTAKFSSHQLVNRKQSLVSKTSSTLKIESGLEPEMNEVQGKALSVFHCIRVRAQAEKGSQGSSVGTRPLLAQNQAAPNISNKHGGVFVVRFTPKSCLCELNSVKTVLSTLLNLICN